MMHHMYTLQRTIAAAVWGPEEAPTDILGFPTALRSLRPMLWRWLRWYGVLNELSVHQKSWAFEYLILAGRNIRKD